MATKTLTEFKTDSRFGYCNTNYAMLALVIEKITGLTYGKNNEANYFLIVMKNTYVFNYENIKTLRLHRIEEIFQK
jgi:hypothetical protein